MTWIATLKGRSFDLVEPRAADVDFDEIAVALSRQNRFVGHTLRPYTVAEHCCRVADILPARWRVHGLLHDAHEAYIGDLSSPFKLALPALSPHIAGQIHWTLLEIARRCDEAIYIAAGLAFPLPPEAITAIKAADVKLLATEKRDLMAPCDRPWLEGVAPLPDLIVPWQAARAQNEFLKRLGKLLPANAGARTRAAA